MSSAMSASFRDGLEELKTGRPLVGFARTLRLRSGQVNSVRAGPSTPLRFAQDDGVDGDVVPTLSQSARKDEAPFFVPTGAI